MGTEVEAMEPGMMRSQAKKRLYQGWANDELPSEVVNMQGKRQYRSCLADTLLAEKFELGGEREQGVDISETEGRGLAKEVQNGEKSGQERREDKHEAEVEQPTGQSERPVRMRKPPNLYGECILNGLQQMLDCLKNLMLEEREPIKTLKLKLLKKASTLQGNCSFFQ